MTENLGQGSPSISYRLSAGAKPAAPIHIPWIDEPDWTVNPDFVREVGRVSLGGAVCGEDVGCSPVVLVCRSGKRSLRAGEKLREAGFGNVFNVAEGFEGELDHERHRSTRGGWRYHGRPWQQC